MLFTRFLKLHLQPSQAVLGIFRNMTNLAGCNNLEKHRLFQPWSPLIINFKSTFPHNRVRGRGGGGGGM